MCTSGCRGYLLPRGNKKPQRINAALLREMWRTASSLELLPIGTKTELGDALVKRVKAGDFKESELWCLSRLGARKLFYGPINLVVPAGDGGALGGGATRTCRHAGDALASMARRTDDPTRDLPAATREAVRKKLQSVTHADRLLRCWMAKRTRQALGRIFGEELPSGLVLAE